MGENELCHYRVLGMKWGIRKAQLHGETHDVIGDNYTDKQKKRIKKQAQTILGKRIKENAKTAALYQKSGEKAYRKADKLVYKSEQHQQNQQNQQKFQKYQSKAWKQLAKHHEYTSNAQKYISEALRDKKRLSDIDSNKAIAGKDYITNMSLSSILPLDAVGLVNWSTVKQVEFAKTK